MRRRCSRASGTRWGATSPTTSCTGWRASRAPGLGAADWGYEDVWRDWYDADQRVIVEIRERSWLKSAPQDVMDQRTCVVIQFRGEQISEMRDYTDSHLYEEFLKRHRAELPKFAKKA